MNDTPTPVPLSEADRAGRPRRRLERHARALVTAVMLLLAFSAGVGVDRMVLINAPVWGAQRIADLEDLDQFTVLAETYQIIREHYVLSDEVSDEELIYGAAAGMVDALGDEGHSRFLDPEQARRYEESRRGEYVGIGITVDTTIHPPRVIMPYQGSPALEAGIRQSDVILAIDGTPYSEFESADLFVELIGGDEGTEVTLELRRDGEVEPYTVTVTRSRIEINPVSWAMMPNDILWIRLQSFNTGASEGIAAALKDGQARGARGVILDLRANPGGLELEAIAVGTQFQPDGTVLYQVQDVTGDVDQVESVGDEGLWQSGPLVVLIDGDSASASEVFSSGVQDNGRGVLVGQTTFGTGTVIRGQPVSDGSMVMIGFELWLTADGNVIWHRGVPPDVEVTNEPGVQISLPFLFPSGEVTEADLSTSQDTQLLVAIEEVLAQMEDAGS